MLYKLLQVPEKQDERHYSQGGIKNKRGPIGWQQEMNPHPRQALTENSFTPIKHLCHFLQTIQMYKFAVV